jgi:hypothetical protein
MKQAMDPAIMARNAIRAKSDLRLGAMADRAAICIPIDPMLENPHKA